MTREEVVNEANNWNNDNIPLVTREIERLCRRAFMAGYNTAMNEADAHPHWLSVEDELPKENGFYLCYSEIEQAYEVLGLHGAKWYDAYGHYIPRSEVTHWMPLPKPPVVSKTKNTGKKGGDNG